MSDGTNFYSSRQLMFSQHVLDSQAMIGGGGEPNAGEAKKSKFKKQQPDAKRNAKVSKNFQPEFD